MPNLLKHLTIDGAAIILPRSEALDWTVLLKLINVIVEKHYLGEIFETKNDELLHNTVLSIKVHVVLDLFALDDQADSLLMQLWRVFETQTLTLTDVFWMYGPFFPCKDVKWMSEFADVYLRMMTWNILNADAENRLHPDVRTFFLEEEGRPYHLTGLLEECSDRFGPEKRVTQGSISGKRRDSAADGTEMVVSPFSSPSRATTAAFMERPIFPARWLYISTTRRLQELSAIEAGFMHVKRAKKKWNSKWDGETKIVKKIKVERDELVLLRRKQLYPEYNDESTTHAYGTGFRYEGWCDEK